MTAASSPSSLPPPSATQSSAIAPACSQQDLADRIDAVLPQTQCTRCGYSGCRPYAQAIADGLADINRCPPGGQRNIEILASITDRPVRPLDPQCGQEGERRIAKIDATRCIGCTLCIQACPVDAIIGAPKWLHAVIESHCTGCDLCQAPCPVDCIDMVPLLNQQTWTVNQADAARNRFQARQRRLINKTGLENPSSSQPQTMTSAPTALSAKQALLNRITSRARQRLSTS